MLPKTMQLLLAWGGALLGAALLRQAGVQHPPLQDSPVLALSLVAAPPLLMGLWIAWRWNQWRAASDNSLS
jgi:hypothetical protein